jgi:phosphoglycerate dehydrogenase-like enzyme
MKPSHPITVFVLDDTHDAILERLRALLPQGFHWIGADHITADVQHADVLVTQKLFPEAHQLPKARWVHMLSAGTEHVPPRITQSSQWVVTHGGGAAVVPVAEWCILMMLHFAHRMKRIQRYQTERGWYSDRVKDMSGSVLRGQSVGVIGYGALGREVARLCSAMGMNVIASLGRRGKVQPPTYTTPGTGDPEGQIPERCFAMSELADVLPLMDFVVLGLRVAPQTRDIINDRTLRCFKKSAVLINPSRGALVDESALIEALNSGALAGAALDVFETEPLPADHPLRDAPNVIISPHCSPESQFYREELVRLVAQNLMRFAANEPLLNVVSP